VAAALLAAGCGGDDESGGEESKPAAPSAANASSIACIEKSVIGIERYDASGDGVEKGVEDLLIDGAKGGEILTGQLGAVVIEYPSAAEASQAEGKARKNESIQVDDPSAINATNKTLLIDYSTDEHVGKIVTACARNPERPPPTP
jgi:hypothetical protein